MADIDTRHLQFTVDPGTATWSVRHKADGSTFTQIHPDLTIDGETVNLAECAPALGSSQVTNALGSFRTFAMLYDRPGGLRITYCLLVSENTPDVLVKLGVSNRTGRELVVRKLTPIEAAGVSLPGDPAGWRVIGDGKTYRDPYVGHAVAEGGQPLHSWWYAAAKDPESGSSLLLGNLTNHKGLGRFTWTYDGDARALRMTAWCDYEGIVMPDGAEIAPETVLLNFGERGTDSLERFGELIAKAHDIDLAKLAPLDPDDPTVSAVFNLWNSFGAGVVRGVEYSHDKKHGQAFQDPEWREKNQRLFNELGLHKFIHP
ncbi:hypothetical protein ACFLSJ_08670 [Verrucomicrobiota bacterium]